jgi:hypothetical protein
MSPEAEARANKDAERLLRVRETVLALGVQGDDGTLIADVDPEDEAEWERVWVLEEKRSTARVLIESRRLQALGILDEKFRSKTRYFDESGRLIVENLPADMRPGSGTDSTT